MNYEKMTKAELIKALTSLQAISQSDQTIDEQQRLLHDLHVHQIELEMQNRELQEAHQKLEVSRNRYADLYDFAPVGYVTLDEKGSIREINLTGAVLFGMERSRLLGMPFVRYVARSEAKKFREHLQRCTAAANEKVLTELRLTAKNGKTIEAQLASIAVQEPEYLTTVYRTAIIDISERKQAEEKIHRLNAELEQHVSKRTAQLQAANEELQKEITERKQAEERLYRHTFRLQTLNEISSALAATKLELQTVLQTVVRRVAELIGDSCAINLLSPDKQWIIPVAYHHPKPEVVELMRELFSSQRNHVSADVAGRVVETGEPVFIPILPPEQVHAAIKPEYRPYIDRVGISSVLIVPLRAEGGLIGTLGVTRDQGGQPYDDDDRILLEDLAGQIVLAIENARLYETAQCELTERQRAEAERDLLVNIVESSDDAILSWTLDDRRIISWNKGAEQIYGYTADEIKGQSLHLIVPPDYQNEIAEIITQAQQGEHIEHFETKRIRKDGKVIDVSLSLSPIKDATGKITAFSAIARDITASKRAEEKLRDLLESMPDAIIIADKDGKMLLVNEQTEKLFGYMREELFGQDLEMLMPERFRNRHRRHRTDYFAVPRTRPMGEGLDLYGLRKNGSQFPIEISLGPVNTEEGVVVSSVIRDITSRRQAEAEQAQLAAIVTSSDDAIISTTADETIVNWNPGAQRLYGYTADEIKGQSLTLLIPPDRHDELQMIHENLLRGKRVDQFETVRLRKDGTAIHVAQTISLIQDAAGQIIGFSTIAHDISQRKQAEEALTRQTQILQSILDSMGDAVIVVDATNKLVLFNPAAEEIHTFDSTGIIDEGILRPYDYGLYLPDKVTPYPADAMPLARVLQGEVGCTAEVFVRHPKAPQGMWVSANARQVRDENGVLQGGVVVMRDITELKQAEEESRASREQLRNLSLYLQAAREQERTHIAREIHDELGQVLTALKMDLSWVGNKLPGAAEGLHAKIKAMSDLVEATIHSVQRISAELRPGLLDDIGLAAAIDWQAQQFSERTGIECQFMQEPEAIVLDRERSTVIFRILQEALTNIARHAHATKVKISLVRNEKKLVLKVRDNGQGISESQIADGKSFGLIGMRERVYPWKGKVKINGKPNKGTVVRVSLPLDLESRKT